ncbi:flagellar basal body rod protein FlgF [Marinomonas sp. 15G1-11]|uniref:Flagellar basal-body rod protein FlgF n=1 Tax=Marinomonas phaeophyticola TaxID=3004091 RepID=A0ABT4JS53_9GAMM|nr:flagellar basal body rod protein FlgF [Marinomonas sp. 15G1-11]MCZ2721194.1 flagellar basal body rod protein FlgF [Marinomonas sp. 15G1-11]
MDRALYLAMSGGKQTMHAQSIHANNLANVSTTGFRSDFEQARSMQINGEHFPSRVFAMTENPGTRFASGGLIQTSRSLDIAVQDRGFITVQDELGRESYTRAGDLQITSVGQLVTGTGLPVMGNAGPIFLPPLDKITIGDDGTISIIPQGAGLAETAVINQIKLVDPDTKLLEKGNSGLIYGKEGQTFEQSPNARVTSGFLEGSNVNAVEEMTHIMSLSRRFELNIKVMDTVRNNENASARILQRNA